jgi:hypothetical protein
VIKIKVVPLSMPISPGNVQPEILLEFGWSILGKMVIIYSTAWSKGVSRGKKRKGKREMILFITRKDGNR